MIASRRSWLAPAMVRRNSTDHEAAFGYRLCVRVCRYQGQCIIAAALLAIGGRAYAADDAQGTGGTPASESNGVPGLPDPVVGASLCPLPDAIWQELVTLVPREHLISRLRGPGKAYTSIQVDDLGAMFRVSVLDKVREYREEARECAYRAKLAALFAALIIDPAALLSGALCEQPPCLPAPAPSPPVAPPPAQVETKARPALPPRPLVHLELGPTLVVGLGAEDRAAHWGGVLRLTLGRGRVVPVLGTAGLWPAETSLGGVRLRQWRLPVDLGVRATLPGSWIDFYGELSFVLALLSERALDLAAPRSPMGVELGGRVGLGARLARRAGLAPFVSLQAEFLPDPPSVFALPEGLAGRTPYVWMGACVGVSWGI